MAGPDFSLLSAPPAGPLRNEGMTRTAFRLWPRAQKQKHLCVCVCMCVQAGASWIKDCVSSPFYVLLLFLLGESLLYGATVWGL